MCSARSSTSCSLHSWARLTITGAVRLRSRKARHCEMKAAFGCPSSSGSVEWIVSVDEWQGAQRAAASRSPAAGSPVAVPCATSRHPDSAAAGTACRARLEITPSSPFGTAFAVRWKLERQETSVRVIRRTAFIRRRDEADRRHGGAWRRISLVGLNCRSGGGVGSVSFSRRYRQCCSAG